MASKLQALSEEVKDELKVHIRACRSAPAGSSSVGVVGLSVRSMARSQSKLEGVIVCSTSQGHIARGGHSPS